MTSLKRIIPLLFITALLFILIQSGCDELVTEQIFITEAGHPIAEFNLDSLSNDYGCSPHTVSFLDKSDGPRNRWLWTFGDGDSSTDTNPTHTYDSAGYFTVTLRIYDDEFDGFDQETKTRYIYVGTTNSDFYSSTDSTFSTLRDSACYDAEFYFKPVLLGPNRSYEWDFGDGSAVSTDSFASHVYDSVGEFEVTLTVSDTCGNKISIDTVKTVGCPTLFADISPLSGCIPLTVTFVDTSVAYEGYVMLPNNSVWDFGNNTADSTGATFDYIYDTPGVYSVTLTTVSDGGTVTETFDSIITVYDTAHADFSIVGNTQYCNDPLVRQQVKFISQSTGLIDSLVWDFGDGTPTALVENPAEDSVILHNYSTEGRFSVKLTAYGACDPTDTSYFINSEAVTIYNELLNEDVTFTLTYDSVAQEPDSAGTTDTTTYAFYTFENTSTGIFDSLKWAFVDTVSTPTPDTIFTLTDGTITEVFLKRDTEHQVLLWIYNLCGEAVKDTLIDPNVVP